MATILLALAGCIGTNPRWDGPVGESIADDGDTTGERGATGTDGGASTESGIAELDDAAGSESSTAESSTMDDAGGESSSESTGAPAPECPGMEIVCDDECHDVASDKHACGFECIDCTESFGPSAKCVQGVCGDNGGGNDDD